MSHLRTLVFVRISEGQNEKNHRTLHIEQCDEKHLGQVERLSLLHYCSEWVKKGIIRAMQKKTYRYNGVIKQCIVWSHCLLNQNEMQQHGGSRHVDRPFLYTYVPNSDEDSFF